jgi:hypothetical protein
VHGRTVKVLTPAAIRQDGTLCIYGSTRRHSGTIMLLIGPSKALNNQRRSHLGTK